MGFTESTDYPALQDMLSSYFYPGEEEVEDTDVFAARLRADNPDDYIASLRGDIARFLESSGNRAEERFHEEFLSYFSPAEETVRDWLTALSQALLRPGGEAAGPGSRYT